ncbi:hypothetical protein [Solimonas sp. SE-A11]|uniref:hypothetical protein n=1 Tax=Solimonas sp. SE-A11 TaxID=3054954 RepID=UPI00259CF7BB|nr:hypothetical protein [Solimonas sp. SE-A11]MDM4769049.1 hypothetical protein [Solimonas sp. SE-A11]
MLALQGQQTTSGRSSLETDQAHVVYLDDEGVRALHRDIYAAFARKPDGANILQGVRAFRKGLPYARLSLYPSPKNDGALIPCEGRPEAAMAESLEIDPDIRRYRCQPIFVPGALGKPYVPDFVAEYRNGTFVIIDVKVAGRLTEPAVTLRMKSMRSTLKQARLRHALVTELELETQPHRQIREALRKGVSVDLSEQDRLQLLEPLRNRPHSVSELRSCAVSLGFNPISVEKLALLGDVSFPTTTQWSPYALLEVSHGKNSTHPAGRGTIRNVRIRL